MNISNNSKISIKIGEKNKTKLTKQIYIEIVSYRKKSKVES